MISSSHARRVLEQAVALAEGDEVQAVLRGGKLAVSRFAENALIQNTVKKDYVVSLTVLRDGRVGEASSNRFDEDSLRAMARRAAALADAQRPDPHRAPLPLEGRYEEMIRPYDGETMALSPEEKARRLAEFLDGAGDAGLDFAGAWSTGDACLALANHGGLFAYAAHTKAHFSVTCRAGDGSASGWDERFGRAAADFDPRDAVERARELALRPLPLRDFPGGAVDAVLLPGAVVRLVEGLARIAFGAETVAEGRSPLSGRMGRPVASPLVSLVDDARHPATPGLPFDFEGSSRQALRLVDEGVARAVVHDRQTALRLDATTTGHAQPVGSPSGPLPMNLRLEAGTASVEDLIAGCRRAVVINRFWYDNLVDRSIPTMTGLSRDGTFLVEDGRIVARLPTLRYNVDVLAAFGRVDAVGSELVSFASPGAIGAAMAVPALRIRAFPLSPATWGGGAP